MRDASRSVAELYRRYGPVVYRRCLRLLNDREAAQDATQEVFMRLLDHPDRLDDSEAAVAWMFTVATNYCRNLRRDDRRRASRLTLVKTDDHARPAQDAVPDQLIGQKVLNESDPLTRAVAVKVLVEDMDRQDAAAELGVSRKTVTRKLAQFLARAQQLLTRSIP